MKRALTIEALEAQGFEDSERIWDNKIVAVLDCYIFNICRLRNEEQFNLQFLSYKIGYIRNIELDFIKDIVKDLNSEDKSEALDEAIYQKVCNQNYQNEILLLKDHFDSIEQISSELNAKITIVKSNFEDEIISKEKHYNPIALHLFFKANKYHVLCEKQTQISIPNPPSLLENHREKIMTLIENINFEGIFEANILQELLSKLKNLNLRYHLGFNLATLEEKVLISSMILDHNERFIPRSKTERQYFTNKIPTKLSDQTYDLTSLPTQQKVPKFSLDFN